MGNSHCQDISGQFQGDPKASLQASSPQLLKDTEILGLVMTAFKLLGQRGKLLL